MRKGRSPDRPFSSLGRVSPTQCPAVCCKMNPYPEHHPSLKGNAHANPSPGPHRRWHRRDRGRRHHRHPAPCRNRGHGGPQRWRGRGRSAGESLPRCDATGGKAHGRMPRTSSTTPSSCPAACPERKHLRDDPVLTEMLKNQRRSERLVAAICASPAVVLAHHDLIGDLWATCYPSASWTSCRRRRAAASGWCAWPT